jgi:hypothetical protein
MSLGKQLLLLGAAWLLASLSEQEFLRLSPALPAATI